MTKNLLQSLSMKKYERLLPRVFPRAVQFELRDLQANLLWALSADNKPDDCKSEHTDDNPVAAWSDFGHGIARRQLPDGKMQFRTVLQSKQFGKIAWLITTFDTQFSVPMSTAPDPLRRAFADAAAFLQEEVDLQSECNQLAVELTERYEELHLVYSTKDEVRYLEEGQEVLSRLVHDCADYLDVGLAALICKDRGLILQDGFKSGPSDDNETLLELLKTSIYNRVEATICSVIINDPDDENRSRIFAGRKENLLAYPITDDHGTAIGIIAVVARKDNQIFSNGDRNLLEVMAKKASRIIHTHHDSLTGLINRSGFEPMLVAALAVARKNQQHHCLLHVDIDQLHVVNDLMGHQEGDALIRRVAKALRATLRDSDSLARLGGDEFAVLLNNCSIDMGHTVAEKIRKIVGSLTVVAANRQLDVSVSIGAATIGPETESIVGVMASAEIACKSAKDGGRDRIQVFEQDNTTLVRRSEEIEWIGRVQEALRDDLFKLFCQPVMPLADETAPPHFEILIRLRNDDGEILSPGVFLPAAERYQLMPQVDRWVIQRTFEALSSRLDAVARTGAVFCINLSGQSLTNTGFLSFVSDELSRSKVPAKNVCFEITETAAISNIDEAIAFINRMRGMGCKFSLDDFGAGLSSFGYLKVLPVDYLKIDGSFVREITSDAVSRSMVEAICQIGRTMGLEMIAEFVGDAETVEVLRSIDVDYTQGYFIGKPVPLPEILQRLQVEPVVKSA